MSDGYWDDPANQTRGNFFAFKAVGDTITGDVIALERGQDFNGNACPELTLRTADGDSATITAGQFDLKRALSEVRPPIGANITITYVDGVKVDKGTMKKFVVTNNGPAVYNAAASVPSAEDLA